MLVLLGQTRDDRLWLAAGLAGVGEFESHDTRGLGKIQPAVVHGNSGTGNVAEVMHRARTIGMQARLQNRDPAAFVRPRERRVDHAVRGDREMAQCTDDSGENLGAESVRDADTAIVPRTVWRLGGPGRYNNNRNGTQQGRPNKKPGIHWKSPVAFHSIMSLAEPVDKGRI